MKKVVILFITVITILLGNYNVYAKDTFKTINKYKEENLDYIIKSYDDKNKVDGLITAGTYIEEKKDSDDNLIEDKQVIVVKYDNEGKVIWKYDYGKNSEDTLFYLSYSYNPSGEIDGYLLVVNEINDTTEKNNPSPTFIKLDKKGKVEKEQTTSLPENTIITKITKSYNSDKMVDGYILVGSKIVDNKTVGLISKYDLDLNKQWDNTYNENDFSSIIINDIVGIKEFESYYIIGSLENKNEKKYKLIRYDLDGNIQETIKEDFDEKDNPKLEEFNDSYLVYGYNHNVKLKNNKSISYYIIKYNSNNEEDWETISNTPTDDTKVLKIQPVIKNGKMIEFLIMATNDNDSSIEITRIDAEGIIKNKVKKINNDYYSINSFDLSNNILYFVGQITCPDEDNCDYNMKSLFLISTEDKVIEVQKDDNTSILVISGIVLLLIIVLYILKRMANKNK